MCSVFVLLMPCNCCLLQPSVYPHYEQQADSLCPYHLCSSMGISPPRPLYSPQHFSKASFPGCSELHLSSIFLEWILVCHLCTSREANQPTSTSPWWWFWLWFPFKNVYTRLFTCYFFSLLHCSVVQHLLYRGATTLYAPSDCVGNVSTVIC